MKTIVMTLLTFTLIGVVSYRNASAQKLTLKWKTDTLLHVPESVLFDAENKILYVSCIDGKPDQKDGKGYIAKVKTDGKIEKLEWVKGLDAPKGMGLYKNNLYVADVTRVDVIDITTGKVTNKIEIEGSQFLNDVTVDQKGTVYISDSNVGKIYVLKNNKPELYFESTDFKGINGLLALNDALYVLDFGSGANYKLSPDKKLTKFGQTNKGADGVVHVDKDTYLVSSWPGEIYYVNAQGQSQKLLDTKDQKTSSADIEFDSASKTLYVPTFFSNSVVAYTLSK